MDEPSTIQSQIQKIILTAGSHETFLNSPSFKVPKDKEIKGQKIINKYSQNNINKIKFKRKKDYNTIERKYHNRYHIRRIIQRPQKLMTKAQ